MQRAIRTAARGLLLTMAFAGACTTIQPVTKPVPAPLQSGPQQEIKLTFQQGGMLSLFDARLQGDSIVGFDRPQSQEAATRTAVATRDVQAIAVRKTDATKSMLATGSIVVVILYLVGRSFDRGIKGN